MFNTAHTFSMKMEKTAKLVVTSYDLPKVNGTITKIMQQSSKYHVNVTSSPVTLKMTVSHDQPKIWGRKGDDVKMKSIFVSGSSDDLRKLLKIQAPDGVYIQLLPQ
jgi:ribosomal protein S17